jgi:selenocysteine lyase/cysteine desulfurase
VAAVTWVHSGTGVKLPIARLAEVVARANASRPADRRIFLMVDGVHGLGNQAPAVAELGCDVFAAGCHKWMFGPRGTGFVWARPEAWAIMTPTIPTMDPMWRTEPLDKIPPAAWMTPGGFHSFEHRWALAEAFRMHGRLGRAEIAARIATLNRRCKEEMAQVKKVRMHTPMGEDVSAGIICFEVDGLPPKEVVERLKKKKIVASVTPSFYVPEYVRYAPSLLTDEEQVSTAVRALAEL